MKSKLFLLVAVAALAASNVLSDGPRAGAQATPGATYEGTTSPSGTVSFTVSADGASVSDFAVAIAASGPGWACAISAGVPESIPIENHAFTYQDESTSVSGSFPNAGKAEGTFSFRGHGKPSECDSGTWTATTTAAPPVSTPTPPEPSGPTEDVPLQGGCNPVASTYPDGTPIATIADAVTPPGILDSVWEFEGGIWVGFSPLFPEVSDLTEKDFLDVVFICVGGSGPGAATFTRPVV